MTANSSDTRPPTRQPIDWWLLPPPTWTNHSHSTEVRLYEDGSLDVLVNHNVIVAELQPHDVRNLIAFLRREQRGRLEAQAGSASDV